MNREEREKRMKAGNLELMDETERLKYEVAEELGLTGRLLSVGWAGLTAGETGRIGGVMARRLREAGR
ncbi:MAG: small, acid-soluble spore protein, alpha/beta type [Clostridia bacterium]|nr:small, acid-soluble spore protein, alpha/beta type [Clostridia bacterium]